MRVTFEPGPLPDEETFNLVVVVEAQPPRPARHDTREIRLG